jgi:ubiquinone biosynthesis protein UbiJ
VTISPERLDARRGAAPADLTITGSATLLALLVYGRAELPSLAESGAVQLEGDPALVERFARVFPRP